MWSCRRSWDGSGMGDGERERDRASWPQATRRSALRYCSGGVSLSPDGRRQGKGVVQYGDAGCYPGHATGASVSRQWSRCDARHPEGTTCALTHTLRPQQSLVC